MQSVALYVHIPFCQNKCLYCDFYSGKFNDDIKAAYVSELCKEIESAGKNSIGKILRTVYFGGGTPTVLSLRQIEKLVSSIYNSFHSDIIEFTIETNPNIEVDFSALRNFGINRLSVGVQSTDDALLKKIGRLHTAEQAIRCLDSAARYFDNISADLMLGLDEKQDVKKDLNLLLNRITHLSAYMLKVEKNTPLENLIKNGKVAIATDNQTVEQYSALYEHCCKAGFKRYEVSNFALEGYESKHNSSYWNLTEYYGVGTSAHSYINGRRYFNKSDVSQYIEGEHSGNGKQIIEREYSLDTEKEEYIMLSLRTEKGLNLTDYRKRFNENYSVAYATNIQNMINYIEVNNDRIAIKKEYVLVQNSIIFELI